MNVTEKSSSFRTPSFLHTEDSIRAQIKRGHDQIQKPFDDFNSSVRKEGHLGEETVNRLFQYVIEKQKELQPTIDLCLRRLEELNSDKEATPTSRKVCSSILIKIAAEITTLVGGVLLGSASFYGENFLWSGIACTGLGVGINCKIHFSETLQTAKEKEKASIEEFMKEVAETQKFEAMLREIKTVIEFSKAYQSTPLLRAATAYSQSPAPRMETEKPLSPTNVVIESQTQPFIESSASHETHPHEMVTFMRMEETSLKPPETDPSQHTKPSLRLDPQVIVGDSFLRFQESSMENTPIAINLERIVKNSLTTLSSLARSNVLKKGALTALLGSDVVQVLMSQLINHLPSDDPIQVSIRTIEQQDQSGNREPFFEKKEDETLNESANSTRPPIQLMSSHRSETDFLTSSLKERFGIENITALATPTGRVIHLRSDTMAVAIPPE